jgi:hypothetical protein
MKNSREGKPKTKGLKQQLSLYFEQNATAYNYLFLVPTAIVVGKFILYRTLQDTSGILTYLPPVIRIYAGLLTLFFLSAFFIVAAHMSFKYQPGRKGFDKYSLVALHIWLTGVVIVAAAAV